MSLFLHRSARSARGVARRLRAFFVFISILSHAAGAVVASAEGSWQAVSGLAGGWIHYLAAAGLTPGALYAVSEDGTLWKSTDGARSWAFSGTTPTGFADPVTVDPSTPDTLYVLDQGSLWKTPDGGATWSAIGVGLDIRAFAIAASSPQTLFALMEAQPPPSVGLWRSDDGGASWRLLPPPPFGVYTRSLLVDPTTAEILYATDLTQRYKSLDGGIHWSPASTGGGDLQALGVSLIDPHDHQVLYGYAYPNDLRFVRSSDGGATWSLADHGIEGNFLERVVVAPSGSLYAVAQARVFTSADRGAHWLPVGDLGRPPYVQGFAVDAGSPDRLYASLASTDGILVSVDGGHRWKGSEAGLSALSVSQLTASRARPGAIYAAVSSSKNDFVGSFRRSDDSGVSWSRLAVTGLFNERLTLDTQPGILYATGFDDRPLLRSSDDGVSWAAAGPALEWIFALGSDPRQTGSLWEVAAPIDGPLHLRRSTDGGASWSVLAEIGDPVAPPWLNPGGIFIAPVRPETVYLLLPNGRLLKTTDGGATVESLQPPAPVVDLAIDPSRRGRGKLYAVTTRRRPLWRSLDGGATWRQASNGLPPRTVIAALAVDPLTPTTLYAATDRGVWVSDDGAVSWQPLGAGLPPLPLLSLAVVPGAPGTILVGTDGAGAYSLTR